MNIQYLLLSVVVLVSFQMTACESQEFHNYQLQRIEKLDTTPRLKVEEDIVTYTNFFDRFPLPVVRLGIGQFHSEKGVAEFRRPGFFVDAPDLPWFYGVGFFRDFTIDQDVFLSIYLSSDHNFTVYNNGSSPFLDLIVPRLYVCGNFRQGVELAVFPNNKINSSDGQFHHVAQISIPILISQGLISRSQQSLCIKTSYYFKGADFFGDHFYWDFNEIQIEPYKIQAVMDGLKAQGVEYVYPVDPIY